MRLFTLALTTGLTLTASTLMANAATIIVGSFDAEQYVEANPRGGSVSSSEVAVASNVAGGYRYMSVTNNTGRLGGTSLSSIDGYLDFSNAARTSGTGTVVWDGAGSTGLRGLDLTSGGTNDALFLDVVFADASLSLTFNIRDTTGAVSTITTTVSETVEEETSLTFLFSSFTGSANFALVDSISLILSGTAQSLDATIDTVYAASTLPPVAEVPVPAAGLLLAGGVLALGAANRRKRNAA